MLNIFNKITKIFFITIAFFAVQNSLISAQVINPSNNQPATVELKISPENPTGGSAINLEISSYAINLDTAKITWFVDGVNKKDGVGIKSFSTQTKDTGQSTIIKVVVTTVDGISSEVSKEIIPAGVDLVIEPTSYVPAFYKSKPLFINEGSARVVAIPNIVVAGKKMDSKNLIFKWKKDGTYLIQDSGMGKNFVVVDGSVPIRDINVGVEVFDSSGNTLAQNSITITINKPAVIFYENSPLYGILYNTAIVNDYYLGLKQELKIIAKPFYFDVTDDTGADLSYDWSINGSPVTIAGRTNELLLKQNTTNLKGSASVTLNVNNTVRIFQFIKSAFNVSFGQ